MKLFSWRTDTFYLDHVATKPSNEPGISQEPLSVASDIHLVDAIAWKIVTDCEVTAGK